MVVLLAKLFYAAMLAGVVAGQTIAIIAPANGDALQAGAALTVELMRSNWSTDNIEFGVGIGFSACPPCLDLLTYGVGPLESANKFTPQWTDSEGNSYQNTTIDVPNWWQGDGSIVVLHFYTSGIYAIPTTEIVTTNISIYGATG